MTEFVLKQHRWRTMGLLLLALLLEGLFVFMGTVVIGLLRKSYFLADILQNAVYLLILFIGVVLCSPALVIALRRLFSTKPLVRADARGVFCPAFGQVPWGEIEEIAMRPGGRRMAASVELRLRDVNGVLARQGRIRRRILEKSFAFSGKKALTISLNGTGCDPMAALLGLTEVFWHYGGKTE